MQAGGTCGLMLQLPEDFVRNFLYRNSLTRTFECFQQEWYEKVATGEIQQNLSVSAPGIYRINQEVRALWAPADIIAFG